MRKKYQKPSYKKGGQTKEQWISDKISEIMHEGKVKQDQAIAMAFSMYDQKFQKGGTSKMFNYEKVGNKSITDVDVNKINKATGIQFTPEFAKEYYSTQVNPPANNSQIQMPPKPVMDITMGLHGSRNIWNVRPETLIGKEPKEGVDYYVVPPKSWESYQKSPEYLNYIKSTSDGLAYMKQGGELPIYQGAGTFMSAPTPNFAQTNTPNPYLQNPNVLFSDSYGVPTVWNGIKSLRASSTTNDFSQNFPGMPPPELQAQFDQELALQNKKPISKKTNPAATQSTTTPTTSTNTTTPENTWNQYNFRDRALKFSDDTPTEGINYSFEAPSMTNPYVYDDSTQANKFLSENPLPKGVFDPNLNSKEFLTPPETTPTAQNIQSPQPFQFDNYFNGVSIPASAAFLGQSIKNKDTLGTVTGGLKLATGLGRSFMAGYGQANLQDEIMKNYTDSQRDTVTQANRPRVMQEGGEIVEGQPGGQEEQIFQMIAGALQQGASPEEVLQMLVEQGLPQEQAIQMIEMVMQQLGGAQQEQQPAQEEQPMMQSGGILNTLKGKRIVDYKYNEKTGNYDVQYED